MAIVKENDLTEGMSGKLGTKFVFRIVKGVTVATRKARLTTKEASEKQLANRKRFELATRYAKAKILDPEANVVYKKMAGDKAFASAFGAAVRDYMIAPVILDINLDNYNGVVGSVIPITVSNNIKTIRVKVSVLHADNTIIEQGEALLINDDAVWTYITTQMPTSLVGAKIMVTAIDRPGNETTQEKLLKE